MIGRRGDNLRVWRVEFCVVGWAGVWTLFLFINFKVPSFETFEIKFWLVKLCIMLLLVWTTSVVLQDVTNFLHPSSSHHRTWVHLVSTLLGSRGSTRNSIEPTLWWTYELVITAGVVLSILGKPWHHLVFVNLFNVSHFCCWAVISTGLNKVRTLNNLPCMRQSRIPCRPILDLKIHQSLPKISIKRLLHQLRLVMLIQCRRTLLHLSFICHKFTFDSSALVFSGVWKGPVLGPGS